MEGNDTATMSTCPFFFFLQQMFRHADGFHAIGILDQTDLISLSITFIQPFDDRARVVGAFETVIDFMIGCADFYFADPAMLGFVLILLLATRAGIFGLQMHVADGAGNAAGRQHIRLNRLHFHLLIPLDYAFTTGCLKTVFILSGAALRGSLM